MKYKNHEVAQLFPMDEENIDALAEDIRAFGLKCPIELCDGKIIDGRRRLVACERAGIEPEIVEVEPEDPIAYVLSLNLHRRHLTPSQKAMVAARAREMYDRAAKQAQVAAGKKYGRGKLPVNLPEAKGTDARDAAGKAVGVSGKSVDFATRVLKKGTPELVQAVDEGRIAVSTAAIYANDSPEEQREIVGGLANRKYTSNVNGSRKKRREEHTKEIEPGKSRGVGVRRAHEAIGCLKRIPKSDPLRNRGFQIVSDYIRLNK